MKRLIILSIISFCLLGQTELKAQFKLQLVQIKCINAEDNNDDETYIMVNDTKVWNGGERDDMASGEPPRSLLSVAPVPFNCPISIRIYDEDNGSDDYCGRFIVNISPGDYRDLGRDKLQEFTGIGQDCKYEITYKVLLDN